MHPLRPHPSATSVTPGSCYWLTSPIRDPIVPPQPDCPKMLMTCCQSAYKQNDMTYSNYRSHRRRNENRGMGERSELREKSLGSRCVLGAPLIKTRTFCLFVMDLFFQDVFFCSLAILLNLTSLSPPPAAATLLLSSSSLRACLFYLAADSL